MNELELLKKLNFLEEELSRTRSLLAYEDGEKKAQKSIDGLLLAIENAKNELTKVENKECSFKAYKLIIAQLSEYITELKKVKSHLNVLKHQWMIIPNYFLGILIHDIHQLVQEEPLGINRRAYLHYSAVPKECYKKDELIDLIEKEIHYLYEMKDISYVRLKQYFQGFKERFILTFDK